MFWIRKIGGLIVSMMRKMILFGHVERPFLEVFLTLCFSEVHAESVI
tara:strand:- start:178 stop:318 length:141 start_codon:yes stop_codon:yes gene_type:complete